jgi:hypothetical protein
MEIPNPPDSGASGTQQSADAAATALEPFSPLSGLPLAQRVEGLAATRPRNLGGEVAATLIAGSFSQMADDLRLQRDRCSASEAKAAQLTTDLADARIQSAVLEERLSAVKRTQSVKQISIFAGTALAAIAIDLYKSQLSTLAVVVVALGLCLLAFGWFTPSGGSGK